MPRSAIFAAASEEDRPDGRISDCFITATSGSAALDEATCNVMYLRARYRPARDAAGNPTIDIDSSQVRWVLPDE